MGLFYNDDYKVQQFIDEAFLEAEKQIGKDVSSDRKANSAWYYLYHKRDKDNQNLHLAAAEHYMYARYQVAEGGKPKYLLMMGFVAGYDGVKMLLEGLGAATLAGDGFLGILNPGGPKPTPASILSVRWGRYGASDGLKDFENK